MGPGSGAPKGSQDGSRKAVVVRAGRGAGPRWAWCLVGWTSKESVRALDGPAFPSACSHSPQPTNTHTEETWESNLTGKGVAHNVSKLSSPSPAFSGWPSLLTLLCLPLLLGSVMTFGARAWKCQGLSRLSRCPREERLQRAEAPGPLPSNNQSTELCCPLGPITAVQGLGGLCCWTRVWRTHRARPAWRGARHSGSAGN